LKNIKNYFNGNILGISQFFFIHSALRSGRTSIE
jgi:hypothetical protein